MNPRSILCLAGLLLAAPVAHGQFDLGKLTKTLDTAKDAGKMLKGVAGIGPAEEKLIGDSVALEIVGRSGGLLRDEAVTRRVTLVGRGLARYSDRPGLDWHFGVLDSDSVNAFSAPDGYVFITRGLYDLADNDDTLAAILSHEIAHITGRHALNIVARGEFLSGASSLASARSGEVRKVDAQLKQFNLGVEQITKTLFEKGFDPQTEYGADKEGRALALTTGYAPGALRLVLLRLQSRSGGDPKTIFSTHPPLGERIKRLPSESVESPAVQADPAAPEVAEKLDDADRAFMEAAEKPGQEAR
jgi:predicted Zn-dependent protease